MTLDFDAATHEYRLNGAWVPSVTQVLRASRVVDFSDVPADVLAEAQERGTKVHRALALYAEQDLDIDAFARDFPQWVGYLESGVALLEGGDIVPLLWEHRVASPKHRYAGTVDLLAMVHGRLAVVDWCSGHPNDSAKHFQTAAYSAAVGVWFDHDEAIRDRCHGIIVLVPQRYSARLRADGRAAQLEPYRDPMDFSKFLTLLSACRIVEAQRGRLAAWGV